jgi:DNA-binding LytR/AlgR family response regulator
MSARLAIPRAERPPGTEPLRTLVVDDDPVSRRLIQRYVEQHDVLSLAGSCASATEAVSRLRAGNIDVVFLDVEMPEMTGLELARVLARARDAAPQVVLVTGKPEYAVEAFDVAAIDYLLKPVQYARFLQAVERVVATRAPHAPVAEATAPAGATAARATASERADAGTGPTSRDVMFVRVDGRLVRIALREVHWVEAKGDYVVVHTQRKRYTVHATMRMMEAHLPVGDFARVHRSHIVRLDRIVDIEESTLVVEREVIPVGASYRGPLLARLNTL